MKKYIYFLILMINMTLVKAQTRNEVRNSILAGDILRTTYSDTARINLYQGNGRFGSCFGPLGLHNNPKNLSRSNKYGNTQYLHIEHWGRAKYNADYLLPLVSVYWSEEPRTVTDYSQLQSFYHGSIQTCFETNLGKVTIDSWFDQVDRNVSGFKIDLVGTAAPIIIDPLKSLNVHYGQKIDQQVRIVKHKEAYEIQFDCLGRTSSLFLYTNATVTQTGDQLAVQLHSGNNFLIISYNHPSKLSWKKSQQRTQAWWHNKWQQSGGLILPEPHGQELYVRTMGVILSTYNDDKKGFPPPMGFTSNMWPFSFPQDLSYVHALLLKTGHIEIAKAWVEQWAADVTGMQEYTKRLYKVDGILCPWVYPYGKFKDYHNPEPPNIFNYETHNSGYLSRMAYETAKFVNDSEWTKKNAMDLVKQTALFYRNIAKKEKDGLWHLYVEPSMGQDEMGGFNQKDYLCALFSAKYCFQKAIELQLDEDGAYKRILEDGLAFAALKSEKGFYFTNLGVRNKDIGSQKHPVQLNDLAFLPVSEKTDPASLMAYKKRYEITQNANKPFFWGWTLGEFLLAGSRAGDVAGWKKDWVNLQKADYADPEWIQIYETSGQHHAAFYSITSALILQSFISNLVDDWFGTLEIAKCNPWTGKVQIHRIHSILGVKISGQIEGKSAALKLIAWKDCRFKIQGRAVNLKVGQKAALTIAAGKVDFSIVN